MVKGKVLYYIFADNSKKNIFNSKKKFKRKKCFECSASPSIVEDYYTLVNEKAYDNVYLIVDILQFVKNHNNYDQLNTMNFFLIACNCKNDGAIDKDCIIRRKQNSSSKIALKNNFVFMEEYSKDTNPENYYTVRFEKDGITKERNIYIMPTEYLDIDPKNKKGYFSIDYRNYRSLTPERGDKFDLNNFKLDKTGQQPIKRDKLEIQKCMKSAEVTLI